MVKQIRKKHSSAYKFKVALEAIKGSRTVPELCQEFGVVSSQIYVWKNQLEDHGAGIFEKKQESKKDAVNIEKLHAVIGRLTVERDFLSGVLKR